MTVEQETSIIFSLLLQGSSTRSEWNKIVGILKYYNIGSMLKGLPENVEQVGSSELHHIKNLNKKTFLDTILKKIQHGYITLTSSLLVDILNNIHLQCFLPETHEVLKNVIEELLHKQNKLNSLLQRITVNPLENISDFLLKILKFLGSEQPPLQLSVKLQIWKLIPFFTPGICQNMKPRLFTIGHKYHELFLAIRDDEFPCDVINARDIIMSAISNGKLDLTKYSDGFIPTFYGNNCLSVLFAFLARLSFSLPNAHPASGYVHTLLSHVKMKYITSNGVAFIPTVQLDIAMFLNSFNTLGIDLTETNAQIYHAFQQEIQWKKILQDFPFSRYSQPRPLFIAMLHKILHTDTEIKKCHRIILKYFLAKVQNTFNQCQNFQILQIPVSLKELNPFVNPTTQLTWPKASILSQPVNVFNAMLPAVEVPLSEPQIITATKHEKFATISTPFHDSDRRFTNERKTQQHTARMFTPLTYALIPKLPSVPLLSKRNDKDKGSTTFTQKYSSNINLDAAIKVVINNNLQTVQKTGHGMLPTTYTVCIDVNNDKLYVSVNDQAHKTACAHITNQQETTSTNIATPTPSQEHESSQSTESCASSPGSVVWVDIPSLMKAVDSKVTETALQLVMEILTPDLIHGFNITSQDTKGKLLYKILSFIIMNINFEPRIMNAIKCIKNNVHMDGPGAERPILICLNYTSYMTSMPPITATIPIQTHTPPIACTDDITKQDGIQVAAVQISSLLTAIAPNAPRRFRNIITELLGKSDISNHLKNFNLEKYRTRGQMLQGMLAFLSHQVNFQTPNVKQAIDIILPFIQMDGLGALDPEMDLVCDTRKPLKRAAEATKSKTIQDNEVQSTTAKNAKSINLKPTKITLPPKHVTFAENGSSSTDEAITIKMETTNTAPAYDDTESTTSENVISSNVKPTIITSLPSYIAYPPYITAQKLTIPIPCVDNTGATEILAYNSTQLLEALDSHTPLMYRDVIFNFLRQPETYKILAGLKPLPFHGKSDNRVRYSRPTPHTIRIPNAPTTEEPAIIQPMWAPCANDMDGIQTLVIKIGTLFETLDENTPQEAKRIAEELLSKWDTLKIPHNFHLEAHTTRAELLQELLTFLSSENTLPDEVSQALKVLQEHIITNATGMLPPDITTGCTGFHKLQKEGTTTSALQSDIFNVIRPTAASQPVNSFHKNIQNNWFDARLYSNYGSLLKGMLTFLRSRIPTSEHIGNVIDDVLPHIEIEGPHIMAFDASRACNIPNAITVTKKTAVYATNEHDQDVTQKLYIASSTVDVDTETTLKALSLTQTMLTKTNKPDKILQVVRIAGLPTIQRDNLNYEDEENGTFICPDDQIRKNIPNITALLESVDKPVSNGHILIVKNFLQRNDTVKLLQGFNLEHLATRADMLAQLITSVKLTYPILEPTLDTALNDILSNIRSNGTGSMKPDFMWVCQDKDEKIIALPIETTVSTDTRTHAQRNVLSEYTVQQRNVHTGDTSVVTSPETNTDTDVTSQTTTTEPYTLPTIFQIVYEGIITNTTIQCSDQQAAVLEPNIRTLLQDVDQTVSVQSLNTVITFFERKDIAEILNGFYTEEYKTSAELLTKLLTFVKLKYADLQNSTLEAFDEILSHIQFDNPATLKPNFIFKCQDISTSQITESSLQTSTVSVIPNNTKTMTAINTTDQSTGTQAPTLSTAYMHDTTTTRTKIREKNTTTFITHATPPVTLTTFTPNEETEIYTLNCSNHQTIAKILNLKSLLNSVGDAISTEHTQLIINFFQRQEILHALQNFNIHKYATKADMLTNMTTFLNLTYTDLDSDVRDTFKNILSNIIFDGKLVTQHDYTELCHNIISETTNFPIQEHMPNEETTTAYSPTTITTTAIHITTKPTTTQLTDASPLPSPTESTDVPPTLFSTSSSKTPILISCVNINAGTQIISYNTTALFDSLDPSTPTTEKNILISYLTEPHTYNILTGLPVLYLNSHEIKDTEFNAATFTTYGSILKEILLFLRNRSDIKHHILTAIDTVLPHIRSQDSSAVHLIATSACNISHAQTEAQSKPDLGKLSANKTQMTPSPQMFTLTVPVETTHSPTEGTTTDRLTTESEASSTHLTTETLTLPTATSINLTQTVINTSIHCSNQKISMNIPNIKTLLQTLQGTISQHSLSIAISFFERHDIVHILKGFHSAEFKTRGDFLNKMLTFIKLRYQHLQQSILDAFNDILSHIQSDALQSLKSDFILVCQDNEIQQHTTSVPGITTVAQTPKEAITDTTQITSHNQQITNSETPMQTEIESATEVSTIEVSTPGPTTISHLDTTESFRLPKLHNITMSGKEIQIIKFCTEQETVSIPNMKTLLQAYETVIPQGHLNAALNFFSRKDIVHVLKGFNAEDFKKRGTLLTNLITFVKHKYLELTQSELNAFNEILSHIHLSGEEALNPEFIRVCEDTSIVSANSSATFVSIEESKTARTHAVVHKGNPSSLKDINEIRTTANKTDINTEEIMSSTNGFADLSGLTQTETSEAMPPIKSASKTPALIADTIEMTLMAVQTTEPATTEPYILGSTSPNTSNTILHSVTKTIYNVSRVLNNTATSNNEVEISSLAPSEETSEAEELYYIYEEPGNEKIQITSKCFDNGTMQIITVDASPLVHIVDRPNMTLLQIEDIFKAPGTQKKLKTFNWETHHEMKGKLLKDIIDFLIKTAPHKQQEYLFLNTFIPFINTDNKGATAPSFTLSCITEEQAENGTIKNITLEDIAGGPAIVIPTQGLCNNEARPTLVVNIHTLFKALQPTTPHLPKAIVTAYLTKPNFYKRLSNFSLLNFKTSGEQLQELLVYLVNETHVDTTLMKATNILLQNVRFNGPGKHPSSVKIVCNSTLNKLTGIPLQKLDDILVTMPAVTTQTHPTSDLAPCIKSASGTTYQIDFLSILHALKPSAPQTSLALIVSFLTKPEFYTVLKNFDVAVYKRRGDLLASLFLFLIVKLDHNQHMVQALKEILPYIQYDGLGAMSPDVTPNCILPDSKEVTSVKTNAVTEPNHPSQGPKLIDMEGNECTSLTPNSSHVQGTTFYKIDVESLTKLLNDTTLQKDATKTLFVSEHLQNSLHILNLSTYSSRAELLTGILYLIENYLHLDHNNLGLVKKIKSHIQFEGEGALPPIISSLCTKRSVKPNPHYIIYATNETCFMPSEYSTTGMTYELQTETLLHTINEDTPKKIANSVISFFKNNNVHLHLHGFNIFRYRTQGLLMRHLLVFLATNPEIKLQYKQAMATIVPYIGMDGPGGISPVIRTTCPESQDSKDVTNITSANDMEENTHKIPIQDITTQNSCRSNPNAIIMPQFDNSLFEALDGSSPTRSVAIIMKHLSKKDIMQAELQGFDTEQYTTKGNLLQALLAFIWTHKDSHEEHKQAAKTLLPHIIFNGPGQQPPNIKTQCYIPNSSPKPSHDSDSLYPPTLVYPTNRTCVTNITHIPGIIVYRIGLPSLFKALKPSITHQLYTPIEDFLSKPYAYAYIHGIYMERYNTRGQLLRAILTILRFTSRQLERKVKQAVFTTLPSVHVDGTGTLPVERHAICSALLSEDERNTIDIGEIMQTITQGALNTEVRDSLNAITKFVTSSQFNLTEYLPWMDSERPITQGELLKLILLQISDKNPNIRKQATILIPYVQEKTGTGKKVVKIGTVKDRKNELSYEIDFSQLFHVLKPEAPKQAVATLLNLFGKLDMYKQLEGFNPDMYQTQGELLTSILTYLRGRYDANTELKKTISALIPFVDHDDTGSLPPIIKKLYIITNTSESVFILDLGTLYKVIPRKNLTEEGKEALDTIFKYLSVNETDYIGLLQSISSRLPPELQLKLILHKVKEVGDRSLKSYIDTLLVYLERQLLEQSHQHTEHIPDMDWIETLHAIPNTGVPALVTAGKKELYKFFLSDAFKNVARNFRISFSLNRAKFLKVLLAYLHSNSEVTKMKVIKDAVSYVYMFIKDEGDGLVSVQDDIILPEERREARNAQNRVKELIYQVLALTEQEGAFEILQTLQSLFDLSPTLDIETTYIGYNVLEEFPPNERLIIILRRIYQNFKIFLNQDTISAIDMVFISLGETKEQTSQTLHFLPINFEDLLKTVLGQDTPAAVATAAETLQAHVNLKTVPLGKAFRDTVPSILNLNPNNRLAVVLQILWRTYSRNHDDKLLKYIKTVYEHIQPQKRGSVIQTQDHHKAIITALTSLIHKNAPPHVQDAKQAVINNLVAQQNMYDTALASLVTNNLPPQELIARALRRFREHQYKINPKLWLSVSTIFEYLNIPEHDSTEDETDDTISVVEEFKYLTDEAGITVAPAKRILMKFMIDRKQEISKIFRGQRVLLKYTPREKMAILLGRLLRIYGGTLEPEIINAAETILANLNSSVEIEDEENIDILQLLDTVIDQASPHNVITAKNLVKTTLQENPSMIPQILNGIIIQKDFNQQRRLAVILRRIYRKFKLELSKEMSQSLMVLFDHLEVSHDTSAEDQFSGNANFELLFQKVFPKEETPHEVAEAVKVVLDLFTSEQIKVKQILHGLHLWKLPTETQVSLILYRLTKNTNLNQADMGAVTTLLRSLDADLDELATQDVEESYTPEELFSEALGNMHTPAEVQEAKGIIMHFLLSGSSKLKDIYRSTNLATITSAKERLVVILQNVYKKRGILERRMIEALQVMSSFLHVQLEDHEIDPYTFDFGGAFDREVPPTAPQSVQRAKNLLLRAMKKRPGTFKKIFKHITIEEYENNNEPVFTILHAIANYKHHLSVRIGIATELLIKFLRGVPIDDNSKQMTNESEYFDENETAGLRMLEGNTQPKSNKQNWP
jgi:hypothetical protein